MACATGDCKKKNRKNKAEALASISRKKTPSYDVLQGLSEEGLKIFKKTKERRDSK